MASEFETELLAARKKISALKRVNIDLQKKVYHTAKETLKVRTSPILKFFSNKQRAYNYGKEGGNVVSKIRPLSMLTTSACFLVQVLFGRLPSTISTCLARVLLTSNHSCTYQWQLITSLILIKDKRKGHVCHQRHGSQVKQSATVSAIFVSARNKVSSNH